MIHYSIKNLSEIKKLLISLNDEQFVYRTTYLFDATIGQHIRHILEFYEQFFLMDNCPRINYGKRERKIELEQSRGMAIEFIERLSEKIATQPYKNKIILLEDDTIAGVPAMITSMDRELFYCLEHSIHHQALIKVSLKEQGLEYLIDKNFGVAYSTIQFKQNQLCVQ